MFSSRVPADRTVNRLSAARERLRASGVEVTDLTESNPTRVAIRYPPDLLAPLGASSGLVYDPAPLGLPAARAAVAAHLDGADPARVALTASTSEAYGALLKLLCDPGDRLLVPQPSYPLLDHLARLEGVVPVPYPLDYHGAWTIDVEALRAVVDPRTRAVVVISPNNPTGSCLSEPEREALAAVCRQHGLALIIDTVFEGYPLAAAPAAARPATPAPEVLTFRLGGLSKAVGLPQLKLGWIVAEGPAGAVRTALDTLAVILDTYLSVSTPVQHAVTHLLAAGATVTDQIRRRVRANHATLARLVTGHPSVDLLRAEAGWYAVLQVPALRAEEALALDLLERDHVLVYPGYFFDFPREAFLVTSLLPEPSRYEPAVARVLARATDGA